MQYVEKHMDVHITQSFTSQKPYGLKTENILGIHIMKFESEQNTVVKGKMDLNFYDRLEDRKKLIF